MGRKHCAKRRNCSLRAISPFPTVFCKDLNCRHVKIRACLGKVCTMSLSHAMAKGGLWRLRDAHTNSLTDKEGKADLDKYFIWLCWKAASVFT